MSAAAPRDKGPEKTEEVLARALPQERTELLRFVTMGSVDDGKSTLIGRLLHDSHGVYDDQLRAVKQASHMEGAEIDYSLFTDGLVAEREQGITIDVAYRYFATSKRKFILADTPGHVQYTRNMATGASTASVAIILIDARLGVLQQSRRHAYIASLLGIPHLVVCVNKLDLVGYDEATYRRVCDDFGGFASRLGFADVTFLPVSALRGDNVVHASPRTPFYRGPTLLEYLEAVPVDDDRDTRPLRYPVQTVLRPSLDYRGFAGQIASGVVRPGDEVVLLPSRRKTRVVGVDDAGVAVPEAFAPMSVTLRLAEEIDVSRGDMIVHPGSVPRVEERFDAMIVWMQERPLERGKSYFLKHTTRTVRASVEAIGFRVDLDTLERVPATGLAMNDIARITVQTQRPLFLDAYEDNRVTGAFILVDALTNDTVAAGMVLEATGEAADTVRSEQPTSHVSASERRQRIGHGGGVVVIEANEDASGSAYAVERLLFDRGYLVTVVSGASAEESAAACAEAGIIVVCAVPRHVGTAIRERLGAERVVFVGTVSVEEMAGEAARRLGERGVV